MLNKIEHVYLSILRIVVLIVATVALLVAIWLVATSLPALARQFGVLPQEQAVGGTLSQYIDARKATAPTGNASQPDATSTESAIAAPSEVKEAAEVLQIYSKGAAGMTVSKWEREILQTAKDVAYDQTSRYFGETKALVGQLQKARGKRLDVPGLRDLLTWNATRFREDAEVKSSAANQETATALGKMYIAGIAFVLFILVVFTFLFVKVERSLRVVKTVRIEEAVNA